MENEDDNKSTETIGDDVKILVTKRKEVLDDEEEQEVVIEALRNIQDLVEYWIHSKMVEGVKDIVDNKKVLTDITYYNDWMSEPKVTGSRVIRVEVYFTIKTKTLV